MKPGGFTSFIHQLVLLILSMLGLDVLFSCIKQKVPAVEKVMDGSALDRCPKCASPRPHVLRSASSHESERRRRWFRKPRALHARREILNSAPGLRKFLSKNLSAPGRCGFRPRCCLLSAVGLQLLHDLASFRQMVLCHLHALLYDRLQLARSMAFHRA